MCLFEYLLITEVKQQPDPCGSTYDTALIPVRGGGGRSRQLEWSGDAKLHICLLRCSETGWMIRREHKIHITFGQPHGKLLYFFATLRKCMEIAWNLRLDDEVSLFDIFQA